MSKLWLRLTLAFGLVIITGVIIAALLANYQISNQFRSLVMHSHMAGSFVPALRDYYGRTGSWQGVETVIDRLPGPGGMGFGRGMMGRGQPGLILADANGQIIYDGSGAAAQGRLSRSEMAGAVAITWQDQPVGYLVAVGGERGQTELSSADQRFLNQINRSLLQAGLIAGGLGVLVGLTIARGLSAPLGRLAAAARRISQGELDQRVTVKGTSEIADLAHAFNDMAANLQQAETIRRNLVADVAHELRTPLTIIQGNLQAILDDVYPLEKGEIAAIYEETVMLNRLVNDLRELAQAEAGQLNLNLQAMELTPLVEETVELFRELSREKGITLSLNQPVDSASVLVDPDRLRQVLHNLLANAARHTPEQGNIEVSVKDEQGFRRLSVTDTGPGIAAEDLPHVFDRFWRAGKSRARDQGGSGLGLAIARQLVESQGGQIGVESKPGRGSCFWFTVPVAAKDLDR